MPDVMDIVPEGTLVVDCTPLAEFMEDLPPRGMVGMRSEQPGYQDVIVEITSNQAAWGAGAGVVANDLAEIELADQRIAEIDKYLPALRKLAQMLVETRAVLDDRRQRRVSAIAKTIDVRSEVDGDGKLLAKYEKTRAYRSAIAVKAAKTRRKNAEGEASTDGTPPVVLPEPLEQR